MMPNLRNAVRARMTEHLIMHGGILKCKLFNIVVKARLQRAFANTCADHQAAVCQARPRTGREARSLVVSQRWRNLTEML